MENPHLSVPAPTPQNVTVRSRQPREYLTAREIERLIEAARGNRWGHRDATAILMAYRHGLRASELVSLRWDDVDLPPASCMWPSQVSRAFTRSEPRSCGRYGGYSGKHLRVLGPCISSFPSVSRPSLSPDISGWSPEPGQAAGFPFLIHMLRHACGYKLANDGQDTRAIQHYLGHRSIVSTVRYTALAPDRFKGFWRD